MPAFEILTRAPDGRWINDWLYPDPEDQGEGRMIAETFASREDASAALEEFLDEMAEEVWVGQRDFEAMPPRESFRIIQRLDERSKRHV